MATSKSSGGSPLPPPPNLGSGSSSSGSSGSGKSSSKKTPPKPGSPGGKDYHATYLTMMQKMGIPITQNVIAFSQHASTAHWNSSTFMYFLRQQDFYLKSFPGRPEWMGEAQYNSLYHGSYTQVARQAGIMFDKQRFGFLLSHNVSAKEFADRATAIQRVKENPAAFQQFQDVLQHRGLVKGPLKIKDLWDVAMGTAPGRWYRVAEQSYLQTSAAEAGLRIGSDITRREIHRLAVSLPGYQGETDLTRNFVQLHNTILSMMPLSRLAGFGLTKGQLDRMVLENDHAVADKVERIISSVRGQERPQAVPQLVATSGGGSTLLGTGELGAPPPSTL